MYLYYIHMYMNIYIYIYVYLYLYMCICVCIYIYMCVLCSGAGSAFAVSGLSDSRPHELSSTRSFQQRRDQSMWLFPQIGGSFLWVSVWWEPYYPGSIWGPLVLNSHVAVSLNYCSQYLRLIWGFCQKIAKVLVGLSWGLRPMQSQMCFQAHERCAYSAGG